MSKLVKTTNATVVADDFSKKLLEALSDDNKQLARRESYDANLYNLNVETGRTSSREPNIANPPRRAELSIINTGYSELEQSVIDRMLVEMSQSRKRVEATTMMFTGPLTRFKL